MNALFKVIITTIIGFVGSIETVEDSQVNINSEYNPILEILFIEPNANFFCGFEELPCEKLKNNIAS